MSKIKESVIAIKYPNVTFNPKGNKSKNRYITPKLLEEHILWLLDWRYNPLTSDEFKQFLFQEVDIPFKSFIMIFEGGYKNIKQYAHPILKRYKIPALIFLVVNHIGDYNRWDNGEEQILSVEDISEMNKSTMFTFGSQSKSHKNLIKCSPEELNDEIIRANALLEEVLRYKVEYFLYPYNKYNSRVVDKLYEAQVPMAFVERTAQVTNLRSFQEIPCIRMSEKDKYLKFLSKIRKLEY
ncbi:MAG: polysaccharide deacetylase family protein [Cyanobacteriota bacterium]